MDYIPDTLYKILRYYFKIKYQFPNMLGKIYAYQMFRSLAYIHNMKICHRDIKPQNVLVDTKLNKLVLCDFGSAKKLRVGEPNVAYICSRYNYFTYNLFYFITIYFENRFTIQLNP